MDIMCHEAKIGKILHPVNRKNTIGAGVGVFLLSDSMGHKKDINAIAAANIQRLMDERGTNASRLALDAGLGHTAVRDFLEGKSKSPKVATFEKIAHVLGVTIQDILSDEARSIAEAQILASMARLSPERQQMLIDAAKAWADQD